MANRAICQREPNTRFATAASFHRREDDAHSINCPPFCPGLAGHAPLEEKKRDVLPTAAACTGGRFYPCSEVPARDRRNSADMGAWPRHLEHGFRARGLRSSTGLRSKKGGAFGRPGTIASASGGRGYRLRASFASILGRSPVSPSAAGPRPRAHGPSSSFTKTRAGRS